MLLYVLFYLHMHIVNKITVISILLTDTRIWLYVNIIFFKISGIQTSSKNKSKNEMLEHGSKLNIKK